MDKTLSARNTQTGNKVAKPVMQGPPDSACSRLALRTEFQRLRERFVTFRRAIAVRRNRQAVDASVGLCAAFLLRGDTWRT